MIERYQPCSSYDYFSGEFEPDMQKCSYGEYVLYSDYMSAIKDLNKVKEQMEQLMQKLNNKLG